MASLTRTKNQSRYSKKILVQDEFISFSKSGVGDIPRYSYQIRIKDSEGKEEYSYCLSLDKDEMEKMINFFNS